MARETLIYAGAKSRGLYRKVAGVLADGPRVRPSGLTAIHPPRPGASIPGEWTQLSTGLTPGAQVRVIAVQPQNPEVLYVGTQRGVHKSTDRGHEWKRTNLPEGRVIWSIAFHPGDPTVMYAGTEGSELYVSKDGGENWEYRSTVHNPDTIEASWSPRIMSIAIEPAHPDTMYVAIEISERLPENPIEMTPHMKCPILGLFGNDDKAPSPEEVNHTEEMLRRHGKMHEFYRYDGAGHSFMAPDRPTYRIAPAVDAWKRILAFYEKYLAA